MANQQNYAPYEIDTITYIINDNDITSGNEFTLSCNSVSFVPDEIEVQAQISYYENPAPNNAIIVELSSTQFYNQSSTVCFATWPHNNLGQKYTYGNPGRVKIGTFRASCELISGAAVVGADLYLIVRMTFKRYRYPPESAVLIEMGKKM